MVEKKAILPQNASFDMTLDVFTEAYRDLSFEEKKEKSFAKHMNEKIVIKEATSTILSIILETYELQGSVFVLRHPYCDCGNKLKKKEEITKTFPLPGGGFLALSFQTYTCSHCDKYKGLNLPQLFDKHDMYPKYIKEEAVRTYLEHVSSYDAAKVHINHYYQILLSKRTIRLWLRDLLPQIKYLEKAPPSPLDYSGYFAYDEEYAKVFHGKVGVRGSKLTRIEIYLGLLRDTITKKPLVGILKSLDEETIYSFLYR